MVCLRITKYNPKNRNTNGEYLLNEWTSISDINRLIDGKKLTKNEYIEVENNYILTIKLLMKNNGITKLFIRDLEKNTSLNEVMENRNKFPELYSDEIINFFNNVENNMEININQIELISKLILREHLWAKIENENNFFIHFGYDYYMYIGNIELPENIDTGLFIEEIESPYDVITLSRKENSVLIKKCKDTIDYLKEKGETIEKGLSENEIVEIEKEYNIQFPIDLKEFYLHGLPVSNGFVNWRNKTIENIEKIRERINWTLEGMIFDIKNNEFWFEEWGNKPKEISECVEICKENMKKVPRLIPIYSHRYISSEPNEENNPIFSVYQTDIICYGENLFSYFKREFNDLKTPIKIESIKKIRFWSSIMN